MERERPLARDLAATIRARALYQGKKRVRSAAAKRKPGVSAPQAEDWEALRQEALACRKCGLCETRTTVVFGEGDEHADLMFLGEAPGRDEDAQGRPFVGRAGKLLTDMIRAMGLERSEVYIANVLKCRPPNNRDPAPDEAAACKPFLLRQIRAIDPKVICTLGRHALRSLVDVEGGITRIRGRTLEFEGRTLLPTYHPAYLLRNPAAKREAWEDLKKVLSLLGRPVPPRKRSRG